MPVISPRRLTSSTSGSLYIPQTTSGTYSSSLTNKSTTGTGSSALSSSSSSSTSGYSSTYRSNGYTKSPSTTYSSSSFYPGSYLSRGALSSSYRASSYLTGGNNDTTTASSRFGQKRSVEAKITTISSNNTNSTTTTQTTSAAAGTTTTTSKNPNTNPTSNQSTTKTTTPPKTSAKADNQQFFLISAFKDQNFLKKECELARSQVSRSRQRFELENGIDDDNNNNIINNNIDDSQCVNNNENGGSPLARKASSIVTNIHDNHKLQGVNSAAAAVKHQPSIKPLIHRAPISSSNNNRFLLSRLPANNNMHCLHSNSELLDDIKYIDSDDTERQQQQHQQQQLQQRQHKPKLRPKSSIISSSNQSLLFEKVNPYKYQNGTLLSSSPPVSSSAPTSTTSTATSSPSSTLPLMGGRRCDTSSIKASIEKFNTLAEAKRLPTRCSTTNLQLSNDYDRRVPLRERSASPATSSSTATTRGSSITSNLAASNSTSSGSIASNNLILRNRSTESSPSHSPKHLRKTSITTFTGGLNGSTSNLVKSSVTYDKVTLTTVSMLSCPTPTLSTVTSRTISIEKKIPPSAPSASSSSSSPSNKNSDIDESVRNTSSLRSTLPPISPKPTRDWDRDSSTSSILSSRNLSDDYSSSSSRKLSPEQEGLCGLRNIGNTCFMNSVIQCLSHTSELTKFLKTQNGVRSSSSKDQQILSEFAKLIREMWTSNVNTVTPSELKRAFSSKHRMYSDYNQQDAQEFLRFFLDSLHSALNSGVKGDLLKIDESLSDNRKADITWEWYAKAENSVIRDLFVGQLKSTLRCTVCGNTSVTFDPVWDLSVPLPSSSRCKLEACLDLFIREEILDGDEMPTCSKCQTRRKSTKSFTIQRFPKYLVIHLKRFSETRWSKMSNIVEFPTGERELNMGPYGSNSSTNVYYSLYAISNHMGSTAGGHYVALCKHPNTKKWHEFNDNVVSSELTESHLVSSSAYILFYERAN
ncbi:ubiquitin carboxyl-terminal hydrolase Usp2 [Eupeodes corollae]|uniref:ubiquitin carboxyl-terminal hydrolase Usp2 n=1 Tax=Eupeodes corollae TaxID=290404 RepID=UPI002492F594|nr:ubiquitin carboxyl-terminal hydrolase Usp2 [Eupeodes corollae]XP_055915059.1 ubiquitin carboxyl-terminal hydrolase Usp2 [Eupeodes corollae]XP_055915060.1 ubiquitin carboxyl-terminal hydrolase Usp2 [Eupeodes corollae]XP_055915061.1 ubiquitin carboxyl-terminal hydrolase Usp2 [Eupeodes corollae]